MRTGPGKKLLIAVRSGYEEAAFSVLETCGEVQSTESQWSVHLRSTEKCLEGKLCNNCRGLKTYFSMSKMPNSSPDQEKFRIWHLKTTWATMGKTLIIHCFEKKTHKPLYSKLLHLWQDFQFCFVFHEAKSANINLYKGFLKGVQIISEKYETGSNWFSLTAWVPVQQRAWNIQVVRWRRGTWVPSRAKSCKGPLQICQERFQVFIFLISLSFVVLWDVGSALRAAQQCCCGCDFGRRCSGSL